MRGSVLRLVSVILLMVVGGLSTARAICVLPCLGEAASTHAATSRHCDPPTSEPATAVDAGAGACDTCDEVGIDSVDRFPSRSSITHELTTPARITVDRTGADTLDHVHDPGPPPGLRTTISASLPLRI